MDLDTYLKQKYQKKFYAYLNQFEGILILKRQVRDQFDVEAMQKLAKKIMAVEVPLVHDLETAVRIVIKFQSTHPNLNPYANRIIESIKGVEYLFVKKGWFGKETRLEHLLREQARALINYKHDAFKKLLREQEKFSKDFKLILDDRTILDRLSDSLINGLTKPGGYIVQRVVVAMVVLMILGIGLPAVTANSPALRLRAQTAQVAQARAQQNNYTEHHSPLSVPTVVSNQKPFEIIPGAELVGKGKNVISNFQQISDKWGYIFLQILHNKKIKHVVLTPEDFKGANNPVIQVNGFVVHSLICVDSTVTSVDFGTEADIDKAELAVMSSYPGSILCGTSLLLPRGLASGEFDDEFYIQNHNSRSVYYIGGFSSHLPISHDQDIVLTVTHGGIKYGILLKQPPLVKVAHFNEVPGTKYDDLAIIYVGNNYSSFEGKYDLEPILANINKAVKNVEVTFQINLIDEVHFIDHGMDNAQATVRYIVLYTGALNNPDKTVVESTEHEVLHLLVFWMDLTQDKGLRNWFADLNGYTGTDRARIVNHGFIPFADFEDDYQNKVFFDFINESSFIGRGGGHSNGNVFEFYTSFVHSLMYVDRLEANLSKLTPEQRTIVIDLYHTTLKKIIKKSKGKQRSSSNNV